MKKTYYEVLGVDPDCTIDEIKKSYKRLALKFHPDKNLDNLEESKVIFTEIKDAYEVLSDATERAWYDRHKDAFHDEEEHHNDIETQLDAFLDAARYRKFNDTPDGFYMVMSRLFEAIVNQEGAEELAKAMGDEIPEFGSSTTDPGEAKRFYDFWCAFQTSIKFTSLNKYDIREAENRRVLRLMEKENAKIRDKARKDRNKKIQKFVSYIRTKDPRILAFKKQTEERVAANRLKTKANRQRKLAEQRKQMENHVEQDWNSLKGLEREIQQIEADLENFNEGSKKSRKNRKKKKNNRVSSDEEEEEEEEEDEGEEEPASEAASVPEQQQQTNGTTDAQNGQTPVADDLSDDDHVDIAELNASGCYCAPCRKTFKTGGAFRSHVQSKKHLERVAYLAKISVTFGDNP